MEEKDLKVHKEQVALAIEKKTIKVALETLISEGHDRTKVE